MPLLIVQITPRRCVVVNHQSADHDYAKIISKPFKSCQVARSWIRVYLEDFTTLTVGERDLRQLYDLD